MPDLTIVKRINGMHVVMKCRGGRGWGILNKAILGLVFPDSPAILESVQKTAMGRDPS